MESPELLTQLGVGGLLVIMILREVLPFLKKNSGNGAEEVARGSSERFQERIERDVSDLKDRVHQLYVWHDVNFPDQPGVKAWYTTPLYTVIKELTGAVEQLADRVQRLNDRINKVEKDPDA